MKLTFIGTGSAFTLGSGNFHSNMLLSNEDGSRNLLIDCGSDARLALFELGKTYKDITDVYISHLHADHVGGLEWLAFTTYFDPSCPKPNLYICDKLVERIWERVLSGGLSSIQTEEANLHTYFNVHPVKENGYFLWCDIPIQIIQTVHVISGFTLVPSYGLMFAANDVKAYITTDCQFAPHQMKDYYKIVDIIFHDCEVTPFKSFVHAHYDELVTLPKEIKNKMWLYHYNPCTLPDAVKDGFRGFVQKGQCFDFTKLHPHKKRSQK